VVAGGRAQCFVDRVDPRGVVVPGRDVGSLDAGGAVAGRTLRRQIAGQDHDVFGGQRRADQEVAELAHVPRPAARAQGL